SERVNRTGKAEDPEAPEYSGDCLASGVGGGGDPDSERKNRESMNDVVECGGLPGTGHSSVAEGFLEGVGTQGAGDHSGESEKGGESYKSARRFIHLIQEKRGKESFFNNILLDVGYFLPLDKNWLSQNQLLQTNNTR